MQSADKAVEETANRKRPYVAPMCVSTTLSSEGPVFLACTGQLDCTGFMPGCCQPLAGDCGDCI